MVCRCYLYRIHTETAHCAWLSPCTCYYRVLLSNAYAYVTVPTCCMSLWMLFTNVECNIRPVMWQRNFSLNVFKPYGNSCPHSLDNMCLLRHTKRIDANCLFSVCCTCSTALSILAIVLIPQYT